MAATWNRNAPMSNTDFSLHVDIYVCKQGLRCRVDNAQRQRVYPLYEYIRWVSAPNALTGANKSFCIVIACTASSLINFTLLYKATSCAAQNYNIMALTCIGAECVCVCSSLAVCSPGCTQPHTDISILSQMLSLRRLGCTSIRTTTSATVATPRHADIINFN